MAAIPFHFVTTASSNTPIPVRAGQPANLKGYAVANVATACYLKFYWCNGTEPPTVGTTVPNLTLGFAASANDHEAWPDGLTGNGQLWVAMTGAAADTDASAPPAGTVVTLNLE